MAIGIRQVVLCLLFPAIACFGVPAALAEAFHWVCPAARFRAREVASTCTASEQLALPLVDAGTEATMTRVSGDVPVVSVLTVNLALDK